jgi:redox-sensing transcriptional repressor
MKMSDEDKKVVKLPTIRRMPSYLHLLKELHSKGLEYVSGTFLGQELNYEPIQVRKDLATTGVVGKSGVGFHIPELIQGIENFLNWDNTTDAVLVGTGSLGTALLGYVGFQKYGLNIVAAFDANPEKIGRTVHGKEVLPLDKLPMIVNRLHIHIGILTVPASVAQRVTNLLVESGIKGIWNFTPTKIQVPEDVTVQNEDLSSGLAVLSVKMARKMKGIPKEKEMKNENR